VTEGRTDRALVTLRDIAHLPVQRDRNRIKLRRHEAERILIRPSFFIFILVFVGSCRLALAPDKPVPLLGREPRERVAVLGGRVRDPDLAVHVLLEGGVDERVGGADAAGQGRQEDADGLVVELVDVDEFPDVLDCDVVSAGGRCTR
jgi:hypothetical protein